MRQSLSLSRPATVKLLRVSLRTLNNRETGKVRIPYAAFKLVRLFSSYEIFHPIWKDWRIVGSRLVTPEGHSLEAGNFHWLSLMARRAEAFGTVNRQLAELRAQVQRLSQVKAGVGQNPVPPHGFAPPLPALSGMNRVAALLSLGNNIIRYSRGCWQGSNR